MPLFELILVIKPLAKAETAACLKRVASFIWNENGVLKDIEYLGQRKLPFSIPREEGGLVDEGSYFLYNISINRANLETLRPEFKLDVDLLRFNFNLKDESKLAQDYECTLEEELLPPVHRKSVKPLLEDKNVITNVRR